MPAQRSSIKPECLCCTTFGCISVGTPPRTHPRPITKAVSVFPRVYAHAAGSGEVSHCERVACPCHEPPPPNQTTPQSVGRASTPPCVQIEVEGVANTTLAPINRYTVVCLHPPPRCSSNVRAWPQGFHPCVLLTGCSRPYKCVYGGVSPHKTNTHTHHATSHTRATKRARPNLPNPRRHQRGDCVVWRTPQRCESVFHARHFHRGSCVSCSGTPFLLFNVYEYGCGTHVGWG